VPNSPKLQIRLPEKLYEWIMRNGGSPWARRILERAAADNGGPKSAEDDEDAELRPFTPVRIR